MATIKKTYNSLCEFYTATETTGHNPETYTAYKSSQNKSFLGLDQPEIMASKYGYTEGIKQLEKLPGIDQVRAGRSATEWNDEDGDEGDHERYLDERPFLSRRKRAAGNGLKHNVKIVVNISEPYFVDYSNLLWKNYTAAKIADELESQGIRTEIILVEKGDAAYNDKSDFYLEITVKQPEEPLNLGMLCTVFSPWFLRFWCFLATINSHKNVNGTMGLMNALTATEKKAYGAAIFIDRGECLNKADAEKFLKNFTITQEA